MNAHLNKLDSLKRSSLSAVSIAFLYMASAALWLLVTELILPHMEMALGMRERSLESFGHISFVALTAFLLLLLLQKQQQRMVQFLKMADEQNALLKQFYELPFVGMAITCPFTQRWLQVNNHLCQLLAYPREELLQLTWKELTEPKDLDQDVELFQRMLQGELDSYQLKKRFIRKDGQHIPAHIDVKCQRDEQGSITRIFATIEDTTERTRREEEIQTITRLYRVVSNISQAIVRDTSQDQIFRTACDVAVNDGGFSMAWIGLLQPDGQLKPVAYAGKTGDYLEQLHLSLADPTNNGPTMTALREKRSVVCNEIAKDPRMFPWRERALALNYCASATFPLLVNGEVRGAFNLYADQVEFFDTAEMALLDEVAGDIAFSIGLFDEKQLKQTTLSSLKESQSMLLLTMEAANLGVWDINLESDTASVSDSYYSMLGFAPGGFPTTREWWHNRIHPDDREQCKLSLEIQLADKHERVGLEYRIQHNDGSWRWLVGTGRVAARDAQGIPLRMVGVNMDITHRIEADIQRARETERATALLVLATTESGLDEKGLLQYGLDLAERLTESQSAFLHFVNADQQTIELVCWSSNTQAHSHAPFDQADILADCFHQHQAVICNDYSAAQIQQHLPEGHFPLHRFINVPTIDNDKVHLILGVGNRISEYTRHDVETVQLIANDLWRIVQRRRAEVALIETLQEQVTLNSRLEEAHNQLLQSEKLAAIGQLSAGVAHELNNPIGFVHSNLGTLEGYVNDLMEITDACQSLKGEMGQNCPQMAAFEALMRAKDYAYIRSDLPQLISESKDGLNRVKRIVQDLKNFSRTGETTWEWADLHRGLNSTLNIVWNELKYKCTIIKQYGDLPEVHCLPSQLNQVFMNLLVNAGHAIEKNGTITICTGVLPDRIWIEIADTGKGIPAELLTKIFDPFFTTKPVGQGTGLGLSLSYSIIQKHQGRLTVKSEVGIGSTFRIELPNQPDTTREVAQEEKAHD